jgi:hypothetical protein
MLLGLKGATNHPDAGRAGCLLPLVTRHVADGPGEMWADVQAIPGILNAAIGAAPVS